jgi:hypothetical protein
LQSILNLRLDQVRRWRLRRQTTNVRLSYPEAFDD